MSFYTWQQFCTIDIFSAAREQKENFLFYSEATCCRMAEQKYRRCWSQNTTAAYLPLLEPKEGSVRPSVFLHAVTPPPSPPFHCSSHSSVTISSRTLQSPFPTLKVLAQGHGKKRSLHSTRLSVSTFVRRFKPENLPITSCTSPPGYFLPPQGCEAVKGS